jgi:spore germination cell wall hydrolase CwlJ-like protein
MIALPRQLPASWPIGRLLLVAPLAGLALMIAASARVETVQPLAGRAPSITQDAPTAAERALITATHGDNAAQHLEGDAAERANEALPFSQAPLQAARPFVVSLDTDSGRNALLCLTQAIYYEAGFEPDAGQKAVAQVVLNRVRHPAFAHSVCGVVFEGASAPGCQFSFACDGSMRRAPSPAAWRRARAMAVAALSGAVDADVGMATHYHTKWISPYWAPRLAKLTQIGAHIFYRWPGDWGRRAAFASAYAGNEQPWTPSALAADDNSAAPVDVAAAVQDRHAPDDVGGRLDVSKGWTLSIPDPRDATGALAAMQTAQAHGPAASEQAAMKLASARLTAIAGGGL